MTRSGQQLRVGALGLAVLTGLAALAGCRSTSDLTEPALPALDCEGPAVPIHQIQGVGETSPRVGHRVTVRGAVAGDFRGPQGAGGFFLQDPNDGGGTGASRGLFVISENDHELAVGDLVEVTGTVVEHDRLTGLEGVSRVTVCRSGEQLEPTDLTLATANLESHEGMLVRLRDELTVVSTHELGSHGQIELALGTRPFHWTNEPSATEPVAAPRLRLDDGSAVENPPQVPFLDPSGTRRIGDRVLGELIGIVSDSEDGHLLHPTAAVRFESGNPRDLAPPEVGGNLKVASFNLLNFFTTLAGRGAADSREFERQGAKHVAAIEALGADIVGLIELENVGDSSVEELVDALNASTGPDSTAAGSSAAPRWAFVPAPPEGLGDDVIRVGMIYRPAAARLVGTARADHDPVFKRPLFAQTFEASGHRFTVVVGHFKSKRCGEAEGPELDAGDGQGCWNALRTRQAKRLLHFVEELQAGTGTPDTLIIGDLNAYGGEDPIQALTTGGLVDHIAAHVPRNERYSYVYRGTSGYLDHALTTRGFAARVTGAAIWHINADEPQFLDYRVEPRPEDGFEPDPFRSSDHDPILIGLQL